MRPDDAFFMKLVDMAAERSTCAKIKVGCWISKSGHPISMGYNGSAPGEEHCEDHFRKHPYFISKKPLPSPYEKYIAEMTDPKFEEDFRTQHAKFSEEHEVHAEINAMADAADRGVDIRGATLYCSYIPCFNCAKEIVRRGIARVVYKNEYTRPGSAGNTLDYLQKYLIVEQRG